jgi:two-component system OmpR family sensor kinase
VTSRVRTLSARTPLRVKLVAALTLLVALALAVTGIAAATALRGYLVERVDHNLVETLTGGRDGGPPPDSGRGGRLVRPDEYVVQRMAADGTVVVAFSSTTTTSLPRIPTLDAAAVSTRAFKPFDDSTNGWRVVVAPLRGGGSVALAADLGDVQRTVRRLGLLEAGIGGLVVLLFAVIGYFVVRSSLRPLEEVEATAEAIAGGDLSQRVRDSDPRTEVGRLSRSLNAMLGQIEHAFHAQQASETTAWQSEERMRRFVADASHELRTPLTSIRGFAELYRQGAVDEKAELDRVMKRVEDEAARMGLLVEDLLLLARLDQQRPLVREPVDLLHLARDAAHDASAVAPDRQIEVLVTGDGPPVVLGDDARLRQVFGNLVTNALTHTPAGTPVTLRLGADDGSGLAALEVVDQGPGLSTEESSRVFERFYRADPSRTRAHGGSGLGLSIVAALVAAHGGRVEVDSRPGEGSTFRVLLPLAPVYTS